MSEIPVPTLAEAREYFDSLRADDQAYLRMLWAEGDSRGFWSPLRLHGLGLVCAGDGDSVVLTKKGQILRDVLVGDGGPGSC
jgi:hypothetical protein